MRNEKNIICLNVFLVFSLLFFSVSLASAASDNSNSESSVALGSKVDVAKFNPQASDSDLQPLYPKAGLLIAAAAFALLVSSLITPLICGTKANGAVTVNNYNMRKEALLGAATPALVIFLVVFSLLVTTIVWNHWLV